MHYNVIFADPLSTWSKKLVAHSDFLLIAMQTKNILVNKQEGFLTENTLVISEKFCRLKKLWSTRRKVCRLETLWSVTKKVFRLKTFWSTTRKGLQNDIILVILQIKITLVSKHEWPERFAEWCYFSHFAVKSYFS